MSVERYLINLVSKRFSKEFASKEAPGMCRFVSLFLLFIIMVSLAGAPIAVSAKDSVDDTAVLRPRIEENDRLFTLTIVEAVNLAAKKFPSIARTKSETQVAKHEITLARTEYLPRTDVLIQELRATQNVTAGTILPQFLNVIPIQSGTPRNSSTFSSIFGSNFGFNFSWELVDFGRRAANVKLAKQSMARAGAQERLTELDVTTRVAAGYLRLIFCEQQIIACQATLDRTRDWALVVKTLCDKGLRPGVDAYRADAEVSLAKIALIKATQDQELTSQDLAESIGIAGTIVKTVKEPLVTRPRNTDLTTSINSLQNHPLALLKESDVAVARSRLHLLDRTWYPHLWWESAIWGRGSGDRFFTKPVADGVVPKTANWGVGLTLQFPVMQYYKVRAEKFAERSTIDARQSNYAVAMQELIKEDNKARILLQRSEEMADETPVLVTAARENQTKARERYRAGLTNVIEVADAEKMLAKAEVEDAESQIRVWQALLAIAYAHGDLKPFLNLVSSAEALKK